MKSPDYVEEYCETRDTHASHRWVNAKGQMGFCEGIPVCVGAGMQPNEAESNEIVVIDNDNRVYECEHCGLHAEAPGMREIYGAIVRLEKRWDSLETLVSGFITQATPIVEAFSDHPIAKILGGMFGGRGDKKS